MMFGVPQEMGQARQELARTAYRCDAGGGAGRTPTVGVFAGASLAGNVSSRASSIRASRVTVEGFVPLWRAPFAARPRACSGTFALR
jgi:hypothetical protein